MIMEKISLEEALQTIGKELDDAGKENDKGSETLSNMEHQYSDTKFKGNFPFYCSFVNQHCLIL